MSELTDKLNEILAAEWAVVRTLRRGEARCSDPAVIAVIHHIRKDCGQNCAMLAELIRARGGRPTDVPTPRFSLQLAGETLAEIVDLAQSAQQHVVAELAALLDEPELISARHLLAQIQTRHQQDGRWLQLAGAREAG